MSQWCRYEWYFERYSCYGIYIIPTILFYRLLPRPILLVWRVMLFSMRQSRYIKLFLTWWFVSVFWILKPLRVKLHWQVTFSASSWYPMIITSAMWLSPCSVLYLLYHPFSTNRWWILIIRPSLVTVIRLFLAWRKAMFPYRDEHWSWSSPSSTRRTLKNWLKNCWLILYWDALLFYC